jgi:hypothetical protein
MLYAARRSSTVGEVCSVGVVRVERVEDRVRAIGQVEQQLDRAGVDAPGLLGDVTRLAAPAVAPLSLRIFGGEIDETLGTERRGESAPVQMGKLLGWLVRNSSASGPESPAHPKPIVRATTAIATRSCFIPVPSPGSVSKDH